MIGLQDRLNRGTLKSAVQRVRSLRMMSAPLRWLMMLTVPNISNFRAGDAPDRADERAHRPIDTLCSRLLAQASQHVGSFRERSPPPWPQAFARGFQKRCDSSLGARQACISFEIIGFTASVSASHTLRCQHVTQRNKASARQAIAGAAANSPLPSSWSVLAAG